MHPSLRFQLTSLPPKDGHGYTPGALGPTRTRTRKNRTRVRVGSKTRTGYPRVLNAPAGPQIRRISASSWARARLRFLRLHAVIKSFIRSAAERGGGRAVVGEVRQTAPVREDTLDGDGSKIRGYTGRNIVWSSNASLNDLEVLSSSMIRISKVQRSPFAPSLLRQLESRAGWHSDLVRICGPTSGDVLDTYHARLTELGAHPLHESKLCTDFLLFAGHFHDHIETAELILATPGFPFMITRAWLFIHELDPKLMKVTLNDSRGFLIYLEPGPADLAEFPNSGGEFFSLVADATPIWESDVYLLYVILRFLSSTEGGLENLDPSKSGLGELCAELACQGIVKTLVISVCALSQSSTPHTSATLNNCFFVLTRIFTAIRGYHWFPEALDHGLLRAITQFATHEYLDEVQYQLERMVSRTLSLALIYHDMIAALACGALTAVEEITNTDAFRHSPLAKKWEAFISLAEERIELMDSIEDACDNMECCAMNTNICSAAAPDATPCIIVQENAKRRTGATMNTQDYLIAENDGFFIYLQLLLFMRSYPNEPYYIMFDYTKGGVQSLQTEVRPTALRSTPSAEIHTRRIWMVPLRTESSYVRNELRHIASHLPADSKTWDLAKVAEAIRDVIYQEDPDAIAIH
ncbi:hypothetical protein C8J57DRAFT_1255746 [Mycena rebaudengoi]|nr:hypothetical protein C8J57DRAFT_1255746 [Mycena rebaudengoi]